ncbi:MAG: polysaccharide pyruvyl transferase family protein [Lachnospiraceae bacterium]|nr:polysaccharide pyruvyl transferase family protein [Lachnospiraceae bacterium]
MVGILNVQWLNNYGSIILAYSMQKKLDQLGVDNEIIDFRPHTPNASGEIPSVHKEEKASSHGKIEKCEEFRKHFLRRSAPYVGIENVDQLDYDTYIAGSDTIWTPLRVNDVEAKMYYLDFLEGKDVRRIAWAASIGSEDSSDLEIMRSHLTPRLKNFDHISVRERDTAAFVQSLTDKKVVNAIDPVLMLHEEDYRKILPGTTDPGEKYIYAFLFDDLTGGYDTINELSEKTNLKVVGDVKHKEWIGNLLVDSCDDGPTEFVERIMNAEYIITDSYHGFIFAMLAHKPFVCYTRYKSGVRARNLLEVLGLEHHYLMNNEIGTDLLLSKIDYDTVFCKIDAWVKTSDEFLKEALAD